MGIPELGFLLLLFGIPGLIILGALISVLSSEFTQPQNKLIWVLVILFLPIVGAILYFAIGMSQRVQSN